MTTAETIKELLGKNILARLKADTDEAEGQPLTAAELRVAMDYVKHCGKEGPPDPGETMDEIQKKLGSVTKPPFETQEQEIDDQ